MHSVENILVPRPNIRLSESDHSTMCQNSGLKVQKSAKNMPTFGDFLSMPENTFRAQIWPIGRSLAGIAYADFG